MSGWDVIMLSPSQSLALRQAIDAMKADDSIYEACPKVVQSALCDFLMPVYSTAELEIVALKQQNEECLKLLEKFAEKIRKLENNLK